VAAATLGIFTPYCSCSAAPRFVGFVSAGVPLGVTFSFLIAAPMVNEVALGTVLAFMMSVIALSLPEPIILCKVLNTKLIAVFVGVGGLASSRWATRSTSSSRDSRHCAMKAISVLGPGCSNCKSNAALIEAVARKKGIEIHLTKVDDVKNIMQYGFMSPPGIVLDGKVVHAGGVPSRAKVEGLLV